MVESFSVATSDASDACSTDWSRSSRADRCESTAASSSCLAAAMALSVDDLATSSCSTVDCRSPMALSEDNLAASSCSTVSFRSSTSARSSSSFCCARAMCSEVELSTVASWLRSASMSASFSVTSVTCAVLSERKMLSSDSAASKRCALSAAALSYAAI